MLDRSAMLRLAKNSALSGAAVAASTLVVVALRVVVGRLFGDRSQIHWLPAVRVVVALGAVWSVVVFAVALLRAAHAQTAAAGPAHTGSAPHDGPALALPGFLAMENFWLILNRTFLVFIAPEGLYGWCARGPVTAFDPRYFEPYEELLEDEQFASDHAAIRRLARHSGGFFLRAGQIVAVELDRRPKWGLGRIPHSGRLRLRLASGAERELILLGLVSPETIRDCIVSVLGIHEAPIR